MYSRCSCVSFVDLTGFSQRPLGVRLEGSKWEPCMETRRSTSQFQERYSLGPLEESERAGVVEMPLGLCETKPDFLPSTAVVI